MNNLIIENKIKELQQEYQKGLAVVQEAQSKLLRIEGAIIQLQELLKDSKPLEEPIPAGAN